MKYLKAFETVKLDEPNVGDYVYVNIRGVSFPIIGSSSVAFTGIYQIDDYYPNAIRTYYIKNDTVTNFIKKEDIILWGKTKEDVEKQLTQSKFDL